LSLVCRLELLFVLDALLPIPLLESQTLPLHFLLHGFNASVGLQGDVCNLAPCHFDIARLPLLPSPSAWFWTS
jgi:hypothetical protein